jgi:hypothetical protein
MIRYLIGALALTNLYAFILMGIDKRKAVKGARRISEKALLTACEDWARTKGCTEFASDCELTNTQSLRFHLNVGFTEANRIICFTKKL